MLSNVNERIRTKNQNQNTHSDKIERFNYCQVNKLLAFLIYKDPEDSFFKALNFWANILGFWPKYWQKMVTSQGFAFLGRGHVEWVKYWQMPSPKTSLFTTIWPASVVMMMISKKNKLAKARKTRKSPGTLGSKKVWAG